jgi:hypothetical protein
VREAERLGVRAGQLGVHDDHCTAFAADPKRPQRRIVNDYTQLRQLTEYITVLSVKYTFRI